MESINEVEDPYQSFVDSIKNIETFKRYKNNLYRFLKLIPSQIYHDILKNKPQSNSIEELSKFFVDLGRKNPKITHNIISSYNQLLRTTEIPMLMIYATPGVIGNEMTVQWAESNLMNLETVHVGPVLHFIQEDHPH